MRIAGQVKTYSDEYIIEVITAYADGTMRELVRRYHPEEDELAEMRRLGSRASDWSSKMGLKIVSRNSYVQHDWKGMRAKLISSLGDKLALKEPKYKLR